MITRGIFVRPADIAIIEGCSYSTAYKRYCFIKVELNKEKHQKISIEEYCNYEGITVELYTRHINQALKPS